MATKLKNIIRSKVFKALPYLVFFGTCFAFFMVFGAAARADAEIQNVNSSYVESVLQNDFYKSEVAREILRNAVYKTVEGFPEETLDSKLDSWTQNERQTGDVIYDYEFVKAKDKNSEVKVSDRHIYTAISKSQVSKMNLDRHSLFIYIEAGKGGYSTYSSLKSNIAPLADESIEVLNNKIEELSQLNDNTSGEFASHVEVKRFYLAIDDKITDRILVEWEASRNFYTQFFGLTISIFALALFVFILLVIGAGRNPENDKVKLYSGDKIYIEIKFVSAIAILFAGLALSLKHLFSNPSQDFPTGIFAFEFAVFSMISLVILLSAARNIKSEKPSESSLLLIIWNMTLSLFYMLKTGVNSLFTARKKPSESKSEFVFRVFARYSSLSAIIVLLFIFAIRVPIIAFLLVIVELALTFYHGKLIKCTLKDIDEDFGNNSIRAIKSEKTKTELITNVSHDLKTPITSIIGYVDLLSKEELNESARDYVKILSSKSNKLRDMVSDLFEISKSEGGNLDVASEIIDFKKLVEQTLADMQDKIESANKNLKVNLPNDEALISTDGKKLYRVLQNLLDNALKYSLDGTRIFVELSELKLSQSAAVFKTPEDSSQNPATTVYNLEIKNISAYEMTFDSKEILSRFSRGDSSRSQEGSGLGLAIAESFTNSIGGNFDLEIDGDMFKVSICFSKADSGVQNS